MEKLKPRSLWNTVHTHLKGTDAIRFTECCYGLIVAIQMESTQSICGQPQTVICQTFWPLYRYRYKKGILEHILIFSAFFIFFPIPSFFAQEARVKHVKWEMVEVLGLASGHDGQKTETYRYTEVINLSFTTF